MAGKPLKCVAAQGENLHMRVASKSRVGHCRIPGRCAILRTIGEAGAMDFAVLFTVAHSSRSRFSITFICSGRETRKARKDTVPHERGLLPMLPSEFLSLLSPIPKLASVARPPTARQRLTRHPARPRPPWHQGTCLSHSTCPGSPGPAPGSKRFRAPCHLIGCAVTPPDSLLEKPDSRKDAQRIS
jgi:hypothetical protein